MLYTKVMENVGQTSSQGIPPAVLQQSSSICLAYSCDY